MAYLMLRQGLEDPGRRARFAAVYGIVGFISVPLTFFSIRWWRTIHPVVIGDAAGTQRTVAHAAASGKHAAMRIDRMLSERDPAPEQAQGEADGA